MPKEWIDVADTAVKIGLGSLITGVFTYIGVKFSHNSEKNRHMLEHKTKMLEQAASSVESYFSAWDAYLSRIAGITRTKKAKDIENEPFSKDQIAALKEADHRLVKSRKCREAAIAKLRLINAEKASQALASCNTHEREMRDRIVFENYIPNYEEASFHRDGVGIKQEEVHKELANFYESLKA